MVIIRLNKHTVKFWLVKQLLKWTVLFDVGKFTDFTFNELTSNLGFRTQWNIHIEAGSYKTTRWKENFLKNAATVALPPLKIMLVTFLFYVHLYMFLLL